MVAATQLSQRGQALARTFAAAFSALAEHAKLFGGEAVVIAGQVAAHLRSAFPMESLAAPAPADEPSELGKLRAEVEHMRPVYVAAIQHVACHGPLGKADRQRDPLARAVDAATETDTETR